MNQKMFRVAKRTGLIVVAFMAILCVKCGRQRTVVDESTYVNPIATKHDNTSMFFMDGQYYYVVNRNESLDLYVCDDPTKLSSAEPKVVCEVERQYGLTHLWHPQIIYTAGAWYIYFSGDNGNTDDHQLYVLENRSANPMEGEFRLKAKLATDPANNWAIHGHVFDYDGQLYMLWSGWESRRIFAETQCLFIAKMSNPWTLSSERVKISEPTYEWERQWTNPDGYKTAYPVYVNESPFFFANDRTDKLYIYFSASAQWTPYYAIGELSAEKGCNLLDPVSWSKNTEPVFSMSTENQVYSPGTPYIIPSPDSTEYFLLYRARVKPDSPYEAFSTTLRMQKIDFTESGTPILGTPQSLATRMAKPSGRKPMNNNDSKS